MSQHICVHWGQNYNSDVTTLFQALGLGAGSRERRSVGLGDGVVCLSLALWSRGAHIVHIVGNFRKFSPGLSEPPQPATSMSDHVPSLWLLHHHIRS